MKEKYIHLIHLQYSALLLLASAYKVENAHRHKKDSITQLCNIFAEEEGKKKHYIKNQRPFKVSTENISGRSNEIGAEGTGHRRYLTVVELFGAHNK